MMRTHKIALDPTPRQAHLLARQAAYARAAYNWGVRHFKEKRKAGRKCSVDLLLDAWNAVGAAKYPWGRELSQDAARHAIEALGRALKVRKANSCRKHAPRFHSRTRKNAFRIGGQRHPVRCHGKGIDLPGIGRIRMREALRFQDPIRMVTIKRETDRWFACVTVQMPVPALYRAGTVIGVDVGVRMMATCSDGTTYASLRPDRRLERKIECYAQQVARQKPGSARRARVLLKLEKARSRMRCRRDDAQYKAAVDIVGEAGLVVIETLSVAEMMAEANGWAKVISRAAMSSLQDKIVRRCEAEGVAFVKASPNFPSTRRCSRCNALRKMSLRRHVYACPRFGLVLDRDLNAARNLKRYGEERQ